VPVPATIGTIPGPLAHGSSSRGRARTGRISGTALFCIATMGGLGTLLAPEAIMTKIFWAVFCLIGPGAVVFTGPGSPTAFCKGARP
jgi:hypothetical protein